jgi:hypothetical protein
MTYPALRRLPSLAYLCIATALIMWATSMMPKAFGQRAPKKRLSALKTFSAATVQRAFTLRDFGSHVVKFGRLTGDRTVFAVFVQVDRTREIRCITAMSLSDGSILWQRGTPNQRNFRTTGEIPVQVYDWNQDGIDDVIFYENGQVHVVHGQDGSALLSTPAEQPYSFFIYETKQFGGRAGLVLHGRTFTTLLGPELNTVWRNSNGFSHFPMALDIDDDGEPELLAGYILFRSNGSVVWNHADLPAHNDAADFGDVDCDGVRELAIATSSKSVLLKRSGEMLWRGKEHHAQHITIGPFLAGTCEKQIAVIDRDPDKKGILRLYSPQGKLLWRTEGHSNRAIMSQVQGWIPGIEQSLILVFRNLNSSPTLYDGSGNVVARLPFRPASKNKKSLKSESYEFVQHFDADNDGTEEIFISNERAIWIYTNSSQLGLNSSVVKASQGLPNPRIFNATFYMGMQ